MGWDIDVREKMYQRRANEIFFRILHGEYALGAKLLSYIVIAKEAGSSPETVRKAIQELQQHSVIEKTRWEYFVSSDEAVIAAYRQQYLYSIEKEYRSTIAKLENQNSTIDMPAPPDGERKNVAGQAGFVRSLHISQRRF